MRRVTSFAGDVLIALIRRVWVNGIEVVPAIINKLAPSDPKRLLQGEEISIYQHNIVGILNYLICDQEYR
ncbi:hypothetical protein HMPREF3179_01930 [Oligella sp. HMSC09E12]|nr:hypothetical protein HMPREF3179_01930 [Oligella sp. HMSC09E12]